MKECDRFESRYLDWKKGTLTGDEAAELARHAEACDHCGSLGEVDLHLRELLLGLQPYRPANGFELRLERAIQVVQTGGKPVRKADRGSLMPRFAALGAGLATGVAVGVMMFTSPSSKEEIGLVKEAKTPVMAQLAADTAVVPKVQRIDSLALNKDTLSRQDPHYNSDIHKRLVSGR